VMALAQGYRACLCALKWTSRAIYLSVLPWVCPEFVESIREDEMKWQEAERQLTAWEDEGCGGWMTSCPLTHGPHSSYIEKGKGRCPGLTRAAHNLMFSRIYEKDAKKLRAEMAGI